MTQQMFILNDVNGELSGYDNQLVQRRGERGGRISQRGGKSKRAGELNNLGINWSSIK